jgi:hypothetical protein
MLHLRVLIVLLFVLIWSIAALTIQQWGRVPHTHIVVGEVTSAEFAAHVTAEQEHVASEDQPHFHNGWILSVPFGDLGAFLAFLLVIALVADIALVLSQRSAPISPRACFMTQIHFEIPHPPPRSFFQLKVR